MTSYVLHSFFIIHARVSLCVSQAKIREVLILTIALSIKFEQREYEFCIFLCTCNSHKGRINTLILMTCASDIQTILIIRICKFTKLITLYFPSCFNKFFQVVAVLLHYFLLTTLMWMLVEAVNMYQALIKVFTKYSGYFMLKRCIAAWGKSNEVLQRTCQVEANSKITEFEFKRCSLFSD